MRLLPSIDQEQVCVILTPEHLSCAWITPATKSLTPYTLRAFEQTPLNHLEYEQSILFNPTMIGTTITRFLKRHNRTDAFISFSVTGASIVETIVDIPVASPQPSDFSFPKLSRLIWEYRYLYPKDNAQYAFYVTGMSRHALAQYQLLAIGHDLNLVTITTERMALLKLYEHRQGTAFRHSQLAKDLSEKNNEIHALFDRSSINRYLAVNPVINAQALSSTLHIALGLYLIGAQNETN